MTHLSVWWWDGSHVADLEASGQRVLLRYTSAALDRWDRNSPVLSCSLPLRRDWQDATVFLRGVLPEGQHLAALAAEAGVAVTDTTALLARYGRDVAGALVIAPEWPGNRPGKAVPYSEATLADEVAGLDDHPLGIHDDSELSIAGLQDKLLLIADGAGGWSRPVGGAPSTHILKVDDRRRPGLVAAEAACMDLCRHLGLTSVDLERREFSGVDCLILSRFDRRVSSTGGVERVHQEDACQALGRDSEAQRGRGKYESAGGPSLRAIANLLDRWAEEPLDALDRLVSAVTFTVLIGNADAHGKNLAMLHPGGDHVVLAPLYDQVPTVLWPELRPEPAMSIGPRVVGIGELNASDIVAEARTWRHSGDRARRIVEDVATRVLGAIDEGVVDHDRVADIVSTNARRLLG